MKHNEIRFSVATERLLVAQLAALDSRNPSISCIHHTTLRRFLADFCNPPKLAVGRLAIDEPSLLQWLIRYAQGQSHRVFAARLGVLIRFFHTLTQEGLIGLNLLADLKLRYGKRSWDRIAQALQSPIPEAALDALRRPPALCGPLHDSIAAYVQLHRSLGKQYRGPAQILRDFDVFL